jgi:hypothetical protein
VPSKKLVGLVNVDVENQLVITNLVLDSKIPTRQLNVRMMCHKEGVAAPPPMLKLVKYRCENKIDR